MGEDLSASDNRHAAGPPAPLGPDWSTVPLDVPCLRCGASLRGQAEPRCPNCNTTFDWDEVLPLDELRCLHCDYRLFGLVQRRCPECGRSFTWEEVLPAARSRRNRLFERLWYHDPAGSLLRTWWLAAFRPGRLWAQYSLFDRPKVGPLLVFILLQGLVFAYGWPVMSRLADAGMNGIAGFLNNLGWTGRPLRFFYVFRASPGFMPFMAAWYLLTFVSLLFFLQADQPFRVSWRHALRVYAHATAFASLCTALACLLEMLLDTLWFTGPAIGRLLTLRVYQLLAQAVFVLGVTVTWAQLWIGYRRHLRSPYGWLLAAVCLFVGHRLAELVMLFV